MRIVDEQSDRLLAASGAVAPVTSASRTRRSASLVSFLWSDKEGELAVISTLVSYDPAVDRSNRSCFRTESSPYLRAEPSVRGGRRVSWSGCRRG
jgi:hypothetical protein